MRLCGHTASRGTRHATGRMYRNRSRDAHGKLTSLSNTALREKKIEILKECCLEHMVLRPRAQPSHPPYSGVGRKGIKKKFVTKKGGSLAEAIIISILCVQCQKISAGTFIAWWSCEAPRTNQKKIEVVWYHLVAYCLRNWG